MGRRRLRDGPYAVADEDEDELVVTARSKALDDELARLMGDSRVRAAALVGATFGLDPVELLAERSPFRVNVRIAAHNVIQNEARKANKPKGTS